MSDPPASLQDGLDRIVLEEAYALAVAGKLEESQRLLGSLSSPSARLCRTRLALASGDRGAREVAFADLSSLVLESGPGGWRAAVELGRLCRDEGRLAEAATWLKLAIERFRDTPEGTGPARESLAALLSHEVRTLETMPSNGKPAKVDSESAFLVRLVEMGKRLAAEADPEQVLRVVLHEAIDLTGTERGFVVLVSGDDFEFALAENLDWTEVETPSFEVSRTLVRTALKEQKPFVVALPDSPHPQDAHRSLVEIGVRSVVCVPIVHAGSTLGVLYLDGREPARATLAPDGRLLDLLATQAGAALDNARAHQAQARALEAAHERLRRQGSESDRRAAYGEILGSSDAMQDVYRRLDLVTPTELPLLILGETGTGKELAARLVHSRGPRAAREFLATNCAGIAESLLETELFGHERGAFTGADRARPGLFELSHGGTLFLDEIGDMSLRMQADLLRVLQSGEVRRVGGRETFHVDVRILAATHRDLEELQRRGEFRQDLYYRLNVLTLSLPPLRERVEDVPLLVTEMLARATPKDRTPPRVSETAMRRLLAYAWPGNVRELENLARRLGVMGVDPVEELHLPQEMLRAQPGSVRSGLLRKAEDEAVRRALATAKGNKAEAARILGVDRKTLYAKLRRISPER